MSYGTSFTGYQVEAPSGSFATNAPSGNDTQPYSAPVSSFGWPVVPPYFTTTTNGSRARNAWRGVTTSSRSDRVNVAGVPLTVTASTVRSRRSRLKLDSACVAVAAMIARAASALVAGW